MIRAAPLVLLAMLTAGAAEAQSRTVEPSEAEQCYAQRTLTPTPPDYCHDIVFHEAEATVAEVELRRHHLRLDHAEIAGFAPAGAHDYYVDPAYLLAAVDVGDRVRFVVESRNRHVVDVYPLLSGR